MGLSECVRIDVLVCVRIQGWWKVGDGGLVARVENKNRAGCYI